MIWMDRNFAGWGIRFGLSRWSGVLGKALVGLPPDFLSRSLALVNIMRLSLMKAARANPVGALCRKSGSPRHFRPTYAVANEGPPSRDRGLFYTWVVSGA